MTKVETNTGKRFDALWVGESMKRLMLCFDGDALSLVGWATDFDGVTHVDALDADTELTEHYELTGRLLALSISGGQTLVQMEVV